MRLKGAVVVGSIQGDVSLPLNSYQVAVTSRMGAGYMALPEIPYFFLHKR